MNVSIWGDGVDRRNSTEWVGKFGKSTMGMLNTVNHQLTRMTNSVINGPLLGSLSGRPLLDDTASSTASRNSHIGRSDDVVEEEEELMRMQHEETKTFSSFEKKIVYFMRNFGSLYVFRIRSLRSDCQWSARQPQSCRPQFESVFHRGWTKVQILRLPSRKLFPRGKMSSFAQFFAASFFGKNL